VNGVKTAVSTAWDGIKTVTSTAFNAVKTAASTAWNAIKMPQNAYMSRYESKIVMKNICLHNRDFKKDY